MFGPFTYRRDEELRRGEMSVGEYAAELLAEVLNAVELAEKARLAHRYAASPPATRSRGAIPRWWRGATAPRSLRARG